VLLQSADDIQEFADATSGHVPVTFDCEGVNLSRVGTVSIVSIGVQPRELVTPHTVSASDVTGGASASASGGGGGDLVTVFLFDMLHANAVMHAAQLQALKRVLEDASTLKIIHDCRTDADALLHLHGIAVAAVFDTQVVDMIAGNGGPLTAHRAGIRRNLNTTLDAHVAMANARRMDVDYRKYPRFWETRPLTDSMILTAAGDVSMLFHLYRSLLTKVCAPAAVTALPVAGSALPVGDEGIAAACDAALAEYTSCRFHRVVAVAESKRGRVIGTGGKNLQSLQRDTGAIVSGLTGFGGFLILSRSEKQLGQAEARIKACVS
jgi:exonuclease 3'-5' domain-containing protein 1